LFSSSSRIKFLNWNDLGLDQSESTWSHKQNDDIISDYINKMSQFQAGERQLRPHRKESTPVELLMEDIRSCKAKTSLRKTAGPPTRHLCESNLLKCCSLMIYSFNRSKNHFSNEIFGSPWCRHCCIYCNFANKRVAFVDGTLFLSFD
jgi:hypothetical protein